MELIGEGMSLADKTGVKRESVIHFLKESFPGPITQGESLFFEKQNHADQEQGVYIKLL